MVCLELSWLVSPARSVLARSGRRAGHARQLIGCHRVSRELRPVNCQRC